MSISSSLAELNAERWQQFGTRSNPRGAAAMCFRDVFQGPGLDYENALVGADLVRILSRLYGLLRPLDVIQPYRLEMGTCPRGREGLYAFWGEEAAVRSRRT